MRLFVRGLKAHRITIKIGEIWESPILHILLTKEDDLFVARCLDFTVSSHGKNEKEALKALAESIKEYTITAIETNTIDNIFDPAHSKFWRAYNELEAKQSKRILKKSLMKSLNSISSEHLNKSIAEITYA